MIASENFSNLSYEYYQGDDLTHFRKCVDVCRNLYKTSNKTTTIYSFMVQ